MSISVRGAKLREEDFRMMTLKDVLHDVLRNSPIPVRQLAEQLGISYSMLSNAGNPDLPEFKLQARLIIPLTRMTGDHRLLDFLEFSCNRVAFALDEVDLDDKGVQQLVAGNVECFGVLLQDVATALVDGSISRLEAKGLEQDIHDVVRSSLQLLQSLKRRAVA